MIRFINIDNGRVYNGDMPYVHWFDGQQSVDLLYVQRLCVLSDEPTISTVSIPNDVDINTLYDKVSAYLDELTNTITKASKYVSTTRVTNTIKEIYALIANKTTDYQQLVDRSQETLVETEGVVAAVYEVYKKTEDKTAAALIYDDWLGCTSALNLAKSKLDEVQNTAYTGVFTLLAISKLGREEEIDEITYHDIQWLKRNTLYNLSGVAYHDYYVYMIYFLASSDTAMEARQSFYINQTEYKIGADFYDEREELKISLGNMGVDLPESVQRAIYPSNVHEEAKDDVLMNRKYKELLMDYMDILGTKGNYKSLINSLNWFEYGDLLKLKEFWKHKEWEKVIYSDRELQQVLTDKAKSMLVNFAKTTYMGIYCAMQTERHNKYSDGTVDPHYTYDTEYLSNDTIVDGYTVKSASLDQTLPTDQEGPDVLLQHLRNGSSNIQDYPASAVQEEIQDGANFVRSSAQYKDDDRFIGEGVPVLLQAAYKWTRVDMSIKMALLGNFYSTYFMPIHLDLIHSTIEDIVYTNAIKIIPLGKIDREDYVQGLGAIQCNVKDGDVYTLGDVEVQAAYETLFSTRFKKPDTYDSTTLYDTFHPFGVTDMVDKIQAKDSTHDTGELIGSDDPRDPDLRNFMINNYNGTGVVIPFEISIPCHTDDVLKKVSIYMNPDDSWESHTFYPNIEEKEGAIKVIFNMLLTREQEYDIRFEFSLTCSEIYVKRLHINVVDNRRSTLKVYKIKPILNTFNDQDTYRANDYMFTHTRSLIHGDDLDDYQSRYSQFIPRVSNNGIQLNHMIVIRNVWPLIVGGEFYIYRSFEDLLHGGTPLDLPAGISIKTTAQDTSVQQLLTRYYNVYYRYTLHEDGTVDTTRIRYFILVSNTFDQTDLDTCRSILIDSPRGLRINGTYQCCKAIPVMIKPAYRSKFQLVLRSEDVYIPHYHYLEELGGDTLDDYTITDETLCVIPDIKYLQNITDYEWIFHNASTGEDICLPSIKEPTIAPDTYKQLHAGFYDIYFRYRLGQNLTQEVSLDSAFFQKP